MTRLNEFNIAAIPSPALARRLANLAAAGVGAVNLGKDDREESRRRMRRADEAMDAALLELAAAVYRETQERLLTTFAIDTRAAKLALSDIDRRMAELARERAEMLARAPKLEDGRAVFRGADGSLYAEDGEKLSDDAAARFAAEHGAELEHGASWQKYQGNLDDRDAFERERAEIIEWQTRRDEWRRKVESGEMTQEEMEELELQYEESIPDRVRAHREEAAATINPAELEAATAPLAQPVAAPLADLPVLAESAAAEGRPLGIRIAPG